MVYNTAIQELSYITHRAQQDMFACTITPKWRISEHAVRLTIFFENTFLVGSCQRTLLSLLLLLLCHCHHISAGDSYINTPVLVAHIDSRLGWGWGGLRPPLFRYLLYFATQHLCIVAIRPMIIDLK